MSDRDVIPHDEYGEESLIQEFFRFVREYFEIEQKWDEVQQFGSEHPMVSLFLIVMMGMCAIPVVIFIIFVVGSVVVSVTGFLFFEGTVIAVAAFILGGTLLFAALCAVGFSIFLIAGYQAIVFAGNLFGKIQGQMSALPFGRAKQTVKAD